MRACGPLLSFLAKGYEEGGCSVFAKQQNRDSGFDHRLKTLRKPSGTVAYLVKITFKPVL